MVEPMSDTLSDEHSALCRYSRMNELHVCSVTRLFVIKYRQAAMCSDQSGQMEQNALTQHLANTVYPHR